MKFTAWRTWLWNKLGRFLRPKRPRTLATAGCVALGLATAWGGEAEADITFRTEVTPTHDLMDAWVYFGTNTTGNPVIPLGTLSGGETYRFLHKYDPIGPGLFQGRDENLTLENFQPGGDQVAGFGFGGIYEDEAGYGVVISSPDAIAIDELLDWSQYFEFELSVGLTRSEQELVDMYLAPPAHRLDQWDNVLKNSIYFNYTREYNSYLPSHQDQFREKQHLAVYSSEATLISFRDTRFAGTAIVTIVPEPQSVFYVVAFACMALVASGNRLSQGRAQ